ncbi:SDR family oxidoreductase [Pseudomaricurvus alkylphenolicus]|uniref:SDR family NAD(P)-dependent oxidoreductase n=1 Tax=Pseudomaricurvus alkylphenolicus TaxID=1306991 RepID=UPI00142065A0|nr:SDR family oxidoreductase [Pseudomaricurvus alkylphenolicus]NIB38344.1 SDR family oxidoreductase [Pseudomaricurvus alkylphenolicus]
MKKLQNKTAIITGAGGGLGQAIARLFSDHGANLILADIDNKAVNSLAGSLPNAIGVMLDVADEENWGKVVEQGLAEFGGIDILINNAGIMRASPLLETSLELYKVVVNTNQTGCFLGMKTAGLVMNSGGAIVNLSSTAGIQGLPGLSAYSASKFAVRGLTKVAALELASKGIRVNSLHPGAINTGMLNDIKEEQPSLENKNEPEAPPMVALKRIAQPEEIAKTVLFLACDDSSYSTGAEFVADGGILAGPSF